MHIFFRICNVRFLIAKFLFYTLKQLSMLKKQFNEAYILVIVFPRNNNYLKIDNNQVLKKTSEQSTSKCYCYVITDIFCAC